MPKKGVPDKKALPVKDEEIESDDSQDSNDSEISQDSKNSAGSAGPKKNDSRVKDDTLNKNPSGMWSINCVCI